MVELKTLKSELITIRQELIHNSFNFLSFEFYLDYEIKNKQIHYFIRIEMLGLDLFLKLELNSLTQIYPIKVTISYRNRRELYLDNHFYPVEVTENYKILTSLQEFKPMLIQLLRLQKNQTEITFNISTR